MFKDFIRYFHLQRWQAADPVPQAEDLWSLYHENSKIHPYQRAGVFRETNVPHRSVVHRDAVSVKAFTPERRVRLPRTDLPLQSLSDCLGRLRQADSFARNALSLETLSGMLAAAVACRSEGAGRPFFSHGCTYPVDLYVCPSSIKELDMCAYYYHPVDHMLDLIMRSEGAFSAVCSNTHGLRDTGALCVLVFVLQMGRLAWKYHERSYRYAILEVGQVVQNVLLTAAACKLPVYYSAAFVDDSISSVLDLDGVEEIPMCVLALGGCGDQDL